MPRGGFVALLFRLRAHDTECRAIMQAGSPHHNCRLLRKTRSMNEEALFHKALDLPPEKRAEFLNSAAAGQPALRDAVNALLEAHGASGHCLDESPISHETSQFEFKASASATQTPFPEEGAALHDVIAGRYTLMEKIGEGGMGEV